MAGQEHKEPDLAADPAHQQVPDSPPGVNPDEGPAEEDAATGNDPAADVADPDADPVAADADEDLGRLVSQLQADLAEARDAALRAQADAQNAKRRAEQDVEKARKFALESFSKELLPVVDNLERALQTAVGDEDIIKPIAEGVELTLKSFLGALERFNVTQIDPEGEPFDPTLHQAMSMVPNPDVEPNTVIAVMQKGYALNGRLVRPAMVMVSKAVDSADGG